LKAHLRHAVVPVFLAACLLLGGSSQGVWRNLVLQLGGIALLAWALLSKRLSHPTSAGVLLLRLGLWWYVLALLQLVPMPPALWTMLPGREAVVESFAFRGEALPWLPLSLSPAATIEALPVMAMPLGIVAAMLLLGAFRARWCVAAIGGATLVSILLGALQRTGGGPYLFPIVNNGAATGLFANANHQGTLLLATIPFLVAFGGLPVSKGRDGQRAASGRRLIAAGGFLLVLVGIALNGSMAALALAAPVVLASLPLAWPGLERQRRWVGVVSLVVLLAGAGAMGATSQIGGNANSVTTRADIYRHTATAMRDSFPVGTGLGTFERVYHLTEDLAAVTPEYINHAHSDPLEWLLETGLPGAILLAVFLFWWVRQGFRLWRSDQRDPVALAGVIASAAMLAHSLVDFPLRDPGLQALFACCLALMAESRSHAGGRACERATRHLTLTDDVAFSG
jgi:O-antigen ligase